MAEDGNDATSGTADASAEGRTCAGQDTSENGSDTTSNPGSEDGFEALWDSLTPAQKKYAQEMVFHTTKAEAAREVGLHPKTVYNWPDKVERAAEMLVDRRAEGITDGISALSPAALSALRDAVDPDTDVDRVTKETAEYIVNRLEGKPTQKQEVEHSGGIELDDQDEEALDDMLGHLE